MLRTNIARPDSLDPTNFDPYWPDNPPSFILCGNQPDGDGECENEVSEGCLCATCMTYNENHA